MFLWYREGCGFPLEEVDFPEDAEFAEAFEFFLECFRVALWHWKGSCVRRCAVIELVLVVADLLEISCPVFGSWD